MLNNEKIEKVKKRKSIATEVANQLIDLILSGQLLPGAKLPSESQLGEMYGVGRSSIRESISALSILGLVDVRVPEGTFISEEFGEFFTKKFRMVSKLSLDNYNEMFEARIAIEESVVKMAIANATIEDKMQLTNILKQMSENINDIDKLSHFDFAFHNCLGDITKNSLLKQIMLMLSETTMSCIQSIYEADTLNKDKHIEYHTKIWDSFMKGDPEAAAANMREHLNMVRDDYVSAHNK